MRLYLLPLFILLPLGGVAYAQIMTDPASDASVYSVPVEKQPENIITPGEGEVADEAEAPQKTPAAPAKAPPKQEEPAAAPAPKPAAHEELNAIRLQGLNKVTARISTLEAPLGIVMRFGNLEIIAKRCWKSPPEEEPENAAFLEIRELKPGEGPQTIFNGWMFSSSPALSGLEHPVYDVTVLACEHVDESDQ